MKELIEGKHYYMNKEGLMVFTAQYHLEKGYCCGNGCMHCPYEYKNVPEPGRSILQSAKAGSSAPPAEGAVTYGTKE